MEAKFNELVNRLRTAHGDNLVSVIVYGSALAAPGNAMKADYLSLVVLTELGAHDLTRSRPVAKWWVEAGFPLPVYFTRLEFIDSLDVFAIEFRHLKRAYRMLYGEDLLAPREASMANLRVQIEY